MSHLISVEKAKTIKEELYLTCQKLKAGVLFSIKAKPRAEASSYSFPTLMSAKLKSMKILIIHLSLSIFLLKKLIKILCIYLKTQDNIGM